MLDGLKSMIRQPMIERLNRKYYAEMDRRYISYDTWIRAKEEKYRSANSGVESDMPVQLIYYSQVNEHTSFDTSAICVFVADTDGLDEHALSVIEAAFANDPAVCVVYGDEDEFNSNETVRMNPVFRPDWSPDTLLNYLYMGSVVAIRGSVIKPGKDIYDLIVRTAIGMNMTQVSHIDYCLYHTHFSKPLFDDRRYRPEYEGDEAVSIIIPSKDNPDILKNLLASIIKRTIGVRYEIVLIDNGSSEDNKKTIEQIVGSYRSGAGFMGIRYIYSPREFNFSAICNEGAHHSTGDYLLFLNDDMEIRDTKWLRKMLAYGALPHVGAVGAKLLYPDSKMIQHCGITNLRLGPVHKLQFKEDDHVYYDHVNDMDRDVIAVTGACLLVKRSDFDLVGGFDEELKVAFNDVDLCFKLFDEGRFNVVVNNTHLWHYESFSRGDDESKEKIERLQSERNLLYKKHPHLYDKDPFYHDYFTADILDSNYTYEYEYKDDTNVSNAYRPVPKPLGKTPELKWDNDCLIISLEQCGTYGYFCGPEADEREDRDDIYIGGYTFVAGSDNSCLKFSLMLEGESGEYSMPCNKIYRPDLEINLDPEEKAALNGFRIYPQVDDMPKGKYRVGMMAEGLVSGMVLKRYTNRYIEVK
ncbi:MAG: glycosyltransferase [Lachnospiraceae bacterium]|nr:glycosyltransferase [Lachnospiraceae bacterium]